MRPIICDVCKEEAFMHEAGKGWGWFYIEGEDICSYKCLEEWARKKKEK